MTVWIRNDRTNRWIGWVRITGCLLLLLMLLWFARKQRSFAEWIIPIFRFLLWLATWIRIIRLFSWLMQRITYHFTFNRRWCYSSTSQFIEFALWKRHWSVRTWRSTSRSGGRRRGRCRWWRSVRCRWCRRRTWRASKLTRSWLHRVLIHTFIWNIVRWARWRQFAFCIAMLFIIMR